MVDVVHVSLGVDELDKILDDGDDVLFGEHLHVHRCAEIELLIDTVTTHFAEVITLLREEKVSDDFAGARIVRRLRVAQLSVDILDCLLLGVGCILLECIEDNRVVGSVGILLVEKHVLHT